MKRITLIFAVLVMLFSLTACKSDDYKAAMDAKTAGNYAEAMTAFQALGDYKDSAEQEKDCMYLLAKDAMLKNDYAKAKETFVSLGEFKDSADLAKECTYLLAKEAMTKDEYAKAKETFASLGDYKDSADLAKDCGYSLAGAAFLESKYDEAKTMYAALGDYKDSADMVKECDYEKGLDAYFAGDYETALAAFNEVGDYEDAAEYRKEAESCVFFAKLAGTWSTDPMEIPFPEDEDLKEILGDQKLSPIVMSMTLVIEDDGYITVSAAADRDQLTKIMGEIMYGMRGYLEQFIEEACVEEGITMEELYKEAGVDNLDDLIQLIYDASVEELAETFGVEEIADSLEYYSSDSGYFIYEDGKILEYDGDDSGMAYDEATDTIVAADEVMTEVLGITDIVFRRK